MLCKIGKIQQIVDHLERPWEESVSGLGKWSRKGCFEYDFSHIVCPPKPKKDWLNQCWVDYKSFVERSVHFEVEMVQRSTDTEVVLSSRGVGL